MSNTNLTHYTLVKATDDHSNGRLLFAARSRAHMSQNDLAYYCGITKREVSYFERCKLSISTMLLRKFAKVLNLEMSYFKI